MSYHTIIYLLFKFILAISLDKIAQSNQLIREAEFHYVQKNYPAALARYESLVDELKIRNPSIRLNLAHCYFNMGDTAHAKKIYEPYKKTPDPAVRAIVYQQLGVLAFTGKDYKQALTYFKESLKADPNNEAARYNFELTKKLLPEQDAVTGHPEAAYLPEPMRQPEINNLSGDLQPQASETNKKPQEDKVTPQQETELTRQEMIRERLQHINLSEDKAQMILDAMKKTEIQYIQQHKKTGSKKPDKDMPDW